MVPPVWALCGLSRTVPPVAPVLTATVVAPLNTCVTFVDVPAGALIVTVAAMAGKAALAAVATTHASIFALFIFSSILGNIPVTSRTTIHLNGIVSPMNAPIIP